MNHDVISLTLDQTNPAMAGTKKQKASNTSLQCLSCSGMITGGWVFGCEENVPVSRYRCINRSFSTQRSRSQRSKTSLSTSGTSASRIFVAVESFGRPFELLVKTLPIGTSLATSKRRICMWTEGGGMRSKNMERRV